jgi:hypothetical protein
MHRSLAESLEMEVASFVGCILGCVGGPWIYTAQRYLSLLGHMEGRSQQGIPAIHWAFPRLQRPWKGLEASVLPNLAAHSPRPSVQEWTWVTRTAAADGERRRNGMQGRMTVGLFFVAETVERHHEAPARPWERLVASIPMLGMSTLNGSRWFGSLPRGARHPKRVTEHGSSPRSLNSTPQPSRWVRRPP